MVETLRGRVEVVRIYHDERIIRNIIDIYCHVCRRIREIKLHNDFVH